MKKVALLTCSEWPDLSEDDALLVKPFEEYGFEVCAIPWDSTSVNWQDFDICIIRSTWNYHYNIEKFLKWVDEMEQKQVNIWNPMSIVKWNLNKNYLKNLKLKGIPIVQTIWVNKGEKINLAQIMQSHNFTEVVIKPVVGASSYQILNSNLGDVKKIQPELDKFIKQTDVLVNPLIEEIKTEGEWSLIFIDGSYSHSVLKNPQKMILEFRKDMEEFPKWLPRLRI